MLSKILDLPCRQVFRLVFVLGSFVFISLPSSAQRQLLIPSPLDPTAKLEVLALQESLCLVDTGYSLESVAAQSFYFEDVASYAEGFLEINRPSGHVIKEKWGTTFDFSVKLKASRDYEDCFVVLRLYAQDGRELLLPFEIPDLRAGKAESIRINPELAFDDLGRGVYYYHFFSGGEEIYYAPTQLALGRKHKRPIASESGSREPEIAELPQVDLPREVTPLVNGQEVLVAIGVNDSGYSVDHLVLSETRPSVGRFALNLVKNARFRPGAEGGFFARKDLLLRVSFDSHGQCQFRVE